MIPTTKSIEQIVDEVDQNLRQVEITFDDATWRELIPSKSGWYLIKTNASIDKLMKCQKPIKNIAHTNIPETIVETYGLQKAGIAIMQSGNEEYVIYNGEADNLKARAREHLQGHSKTFCLGLSNYQNIIGQFKWVFCYVSASDCKTVQNKADKILRNAIEQAWRVKHGWPILCRK